MKGWGSLVVGMAGLVSCLALAPADHAASKHAVNFANDIAPILYDKCARCHHTGEVAPFPLVSYEDAKARAKTIAAVVSQKYMPPWQAHSHGEFVNERTLTDEQIATLTDWAKNGAPEGDPGSIPPPPKFTSDWQLGAPDFVGKPAKSYTVGPEGDDLYRCFVVPTNFDAGRFVTGVEVRPGNRRVVHHVIAYLDTSGAARARDGADGAPGYTSFGGPGFAPSGALGGWVPGLDAQVTPTGVGIWLPKGADIVLQVHYHRDGKPEADNTQIGLTFAKGQIDKRIRSTALGNPFISIAPGDAHYEVKANLTIPANVTVYDVLPHMHLLGHDMTVNATLPDGTVKQLIDVEPYDFNWQTRYTYREPVKLPKGTKLNLVSHYDNSTSNIHNPNNPPKRVTFGEQTTNEMCFAFFSYSVDSEHIVGGRPVDELNMGDGTAERIIDDIFTRFDANRDGYLDVTELAAVIKFFRSSTGPRGENIDPDGAAKLLMALFDKNKDGKLDRAEFRALAQSVQRQAGKKS
ncbi:MAG TPA: EF-hand domain-containing protein [Fimbriimonadaceae bacterium]|nr:EF-hand domain-containing protein [Fimbriimonadaceae bacterium]